MHRDNDERNEQLYGQGLVSAIKPPPRGTLNDNHGIAPFTVWSARDKHWQDRKRRWVGLGIASELGRADDLTYSGAVKAFDHYRVKEGKRVGTSMQGSSIFDPVVCEVCYSWWCKPEGIILDPFAGGSVRGVMASLLGFKYWGCDLRAEQIDANNEQVEQNVKLRGKYKPRWVCGDSNATVPGAPLADFVFTCPPYGNLEVYSKDEGDISQFEYEEFEPMHAGIIRKACDRLRPNRFAGWVVANFRDKKTGNYHNFVGDTIRAFEAAGLHLYTENILVTPVGTAAMRSNTNFIRGHRKTVKVHQNVLTFIKGDPKIACDEIIAAGG